ncbi:MAG: hypothetical protein ACRDQX_16020 [Pseudonocardiaceae bacterium]
MPAPEETAAIVMAAADGLVPHRTLTQTGTRPGRGSPEQAGRLTVINEAVHT